jgi:Ca2+-binding EF-hand superfamily protein
MDIADTDGSGTVDLGEFTEFINKLSPETTPEELKEIFESIDEDKSGELDK